ncbi:MAG: hypothetical protein ACI350_00785 [Prevotella sp.]
MIKVEGINMLIKKVLEDDTQNCYPAMAQDKELQEMEKEFYNIIDNLPKQERLKMEEIFSRYTARITRIAYLKGMKDFAELHITLKDDIDNMCQTADYLR